MNKNKYTFGLVNFKKAHCRSFKKDHYIVRKVIIGLVLIFLISFFWYQRAINKPIDQNDRTNIQFIINRGESSSTILNKLTQQHLIRSKLALMIYSKINNDFATEIKAGNYILKKSFSAVEIITILTSNLNSQELTITIPEGYKIEEIAEYLEKLAPNFSSQDFKNAAQMKEEYSNYSFLVNLKNGDSLEGYLFPDTYNIFANARSEDIIIKMLNNFEDKVDQNLRNEILEQGRTLNDIVILASIIEKESPTNDMYKIAGVFWNRLKAGYRLESDATVNYVLGTNNLQPSFEATEVQHPYNTYENAGLPPGPISNPGLNAIKAAIFPENHSYYFFLSKKNKETVFSKTFEEHLQNKAKYLD